MAAISCPLGGVGFHAALSLALEVPERGQWGSPVPSLWPLLSLSAPTSPVTWPPCWCSVISFLSKPFCTYILLGPPLFLSGAVRRTLSFPSKIRLCCLCWVTQPRRQKQKQFFFFSYRSWKKWNQWERSAHNGPVATCKVHSTVWGRYGPLSGREHSWWREYCNLWREYSI